MDGSLQLDRSAAMAPRAWPRHPRQLALEHAAGKLFQKWEAGVAIIGLFLLTRAFSSLMTGGETNPNGESAVLRTVYTSVYVLILPAVLLHRRAVLAVGIRHTWTLALVALGLLSAQWSAAPDLTLRRSIAWTLTTLFGVYLAARYDMRTQLKLLAAALGSAAVLSTAFAVAVPSVGVESEIHVGAWRGIYPQKNNLGQSMVLSTMTFLLLAPCLTRRRWIAWAGAGLSAALVLLSTSKTALAILLTLGLLAVLFRSLRWRYTLFVPFLSACVLVGGSVALLLVSQSDRILVAMGKDPTLTGRTPMWDIVLEMILRRPWLGYGHSSFWLDGSDSPAAEVQAFLQWETPHAHNGYLDLGLELGLVGLSIFLIGFAGAFVKSVAALRAVRTADALWPIMYLSFILLYNVTESGLAVRHSIYWVLYVATVCSWLLHRPEGDGSGTTELPHSERGGIQASSLRQGHGAPELRFES
jgi:exopolysaccharide production protein ExoQ